MVVREYDPQWPFQFEKLKSEIEKNLKTDHSIHHIGSTSIQGMCAKPIIDINLEIESPSDFDAIRTELPFLSPVPQDQA